MSKRMIVKLLFIRSRFGVSNLFLRDEMSYLVMNILYGVGCACCSVLGKSKHCERIRICFIKQWVHSVHVVSFIRASKRWASSSQQQHVKSIRRQQANTLFASPKRVALFCSPFRSMVFMNDCGWLILHTSFIFVWFGEVKKSSYILLEYNQLI